MAVHITFPKSRERAEINLYRVSSVRIESSWKEFTGRAEITLPRNVRLIKEKKYSELFKAGDPVIIRLGYGAGDLPVEFTGYLSDVSEGVPVVLRCEDEMWKLKRGCVSVVSGNITLRNLLEQAAPGYEIDCPDMSLGAVRYANVVPVAILEQLKKELLLNSYFDDKTLRCGVIYGDQSDVKPANVFIEKNAISENLNRKNTTELVLVELISVLSGGKKITVKAGMEGGIVHKNNIGYAVSEKELKKIAERILKQYQASGFDGSITLFGVPRVKHGMKINLKSEFYKNMEGTFYIESVKKTFDEGGYRQEVTLGDKAI